MSHVQQMTVQDLSERLAAGAAGRWLIDVRTEDERSLARVEGFQRLDPPLAEKIEALDRETELVFLCHHGHRSDAAARHFLTLGFRRVWNVLGGIDAWSREIDPSVPRY